jgi:hypothetical protein
MVMMRVLCVVVSASLAACWHGVPTRTEIGEQQPLSFVARVNGLSDLQNKTEALEPKLAATLRRILRLGTEEERVAIQDQLGTLRDEIAQLALTARVARKRGDNPAVLDRVDARIAEAEAGIAKLGEGLSYANTYADLEALENQHADFRAWHGNRRVGIDDFGP